MRNSSLVEGSCAENVTGLKSAAEAVDVQVQTGANAGHKAAFGRARCQREAKVWSMPGHGRGAFLGRRRSVAKPAGARGSENPGMSSVNQGENP